MFWREEKDKSRDLENSRQNLEEELDEGMSLLGFNRKAEELRDGRRGNLSIDDGNARQIIEEETEATDKARKKKPRGEADGEDLADEVVDQPWWRR